MAIETHRPRIPLWWALLISLPWFVGNWQEMVSAQPLTFTVSRFISNPIAITSIWSLNLLFNFMVGIFASYFSDRIWTRLGRRRPFLITSFFLSGIALVLIPLMPNIWLLVGAIVFYQFTVDLGKPWEPLFNEVVPPTQRGAAQTFRMIMNTVTQMFFTGVLLANWDNRLFEPLPGVRLPLNGEEVLYWTCAAAMFACSAFLVFFVRETPPPVAPVVEAFSPIRMFKDIFAERRALLVYMLYLCPLIATAGTGALIPLLRRDQFGFTMRQIGSAEAISALAVTLVVLPVLGYLADRMPRMWLFRIGIIVPALVNAACFFVAPRVVPGFVMGFTAFAVIITLAAIFQNCLWMVWGPLVYDYIPSNRMGTYASGFSFASVVSFVLVNLGGIWVKLFTGWFGSGPYVTPPSATETAARTDYSSLYLLNLLFSAIALGLTFVFAHAERRGAILPEGRIELQREEELARAAHAGPAEPPDRTG